MTLLILWFIIATMLSVLMWGGLLPQRKYYPLKIKLMNAKAAICLALLQGKTISIRTGFFDLAITNVPREIGRAVERPFGVIVTRTPKEGQSKWGVPCSWFEYRLEKSEINREGIEKMKIYCKQHMEISQPKTDAQQKQFRQTQLLLQ